MVYEMPVVTWDNDRLAPYVVVDCIGCGPVKRQAAKMPAKEADAKGPCIGWGLQRVVWQEGLWGSERGCTKDRVCSLHLHGCFYF
jgi:hypothetical protein